jgi:flagellar motor switch protein FliM
MESHSSNAETMAEASAQQARVPSVRSCNFRYAGRLSNENARFLTGLHQKFALNVTTALELYLGATLRLTPVSLEQLAIQDYVVGLVPNNYLLPCAIGGMDSNCILEMDTGILWPIIDLLLGGAGQLAGDYRELTELDEKIVESVIALIVSELERSWSALSLTLTPGRCIKPTLIQHMFRANEKLVLLVFEMTIGGTTGSFNLVLPSPFVGFLLRRLKVSQSKKVSGLRLPIPGLRERILDGVFVVSSDVVQMRVLVKDFVDLKPGSILRTGTPVKNPGRLTVEGAEIFEALPVRVGRKKAAQLTVRCQEPPITKE